MHVKLHNLVYADGEQGKFSIAFENGQEFKILDWIKNRNFEDYMHEKYRMKKHTRKRNKLYTFQHPETNSEVILKVSKVNKDYKFLRRLNLFFSTLKEDYNLRAYKGAKLLNSIGVDCPTPIAYWNEKGKFFTKESYYLYEKILSEHSLHTFTQQLLESNSNNKDEIFRYLAIKVTSIVRKIHSAGFRQGDPHPGNFLIDISNYNIEQLSISDLESSHISIIDLDKFEIASSYGNSINMFYNIRCLRRCTIYGFDQYEMLKLYLKENYNVFWKGILWFWIKGGFNPVSWFRAPKRGR